MQPAAEYRCEKLVSLKSRNHFERGQVSFGRALVWDDFSVTYAGRDMIEDQIVTIQEYVPEAIARREQNG